MRALAIAALALLACNQLLGGSEVRLGDGGTSDAPNDGRGIDGRPVDAPAGCVPGGRQCNNCIDDDADGAIDSADTECTSPDDNDEGSFATGIPGDNTDPVNQDCFFDGNSGNADDGCQVHVCCILGATAPSECPISGAGYNPTNCPPPIGTKALPPTCIGGCGARAPVGCDCWGCCSVIDRVTNTPIDILLHPLTSPGCNATTVGDPSKCTRCTKNLNCGHPSCGGTCVLCPGQTVNDLPASCGNMPQCPTGVAVCTADTDCPAGDYCDQSSRCCIGR